MSANTYLHARYGQVWPADQKSEDAFEVPLHTLEINQDNPNREESPQYSAEFTGQGKAVLVLYTPSRVIAHFDTFADAQTAAEALNNHHGY